VCTLLLVAASHWSHLRKFREAIESGVPVPQPRQSDRNRTGISELPSDALTVVFE
jgi:hypothetical protein